MSNAKSARHDQQAPLAGRVTVAAETPDRKRTDTLHDTSQDTQALNPGPTQGRPDESRRCAFCDAAMSKGMRRHAVYCCPRCRAGASRRQRKTQSGA